MCASKGSLFSLLGSESCQPANHGGVGIFVFGFETEKFTQFFERRLHASILPYVKHKTVAIGMKIRIGAILIWLAVWLCTSSGYFYFATA